MAGNLVLARHAAGQRWLDVGCGTGRLVERLLAHGVDAVGIDADPAMIRHARERAAVAGSQVPCIVSVAERLPLPDASIDGVVAVSLLGCLESPSAFYAEIQRILKPQGSAVLTCTNRSSWLLRVNHVMTGKRRKMVRGEEGTRSAGGGDPTGRAHGSGAEAGRARGSGAAASFDRGEPAGGGTYRLFTEGEVRQRLVDAGFIVEKVHYYNMMLVFGGRLFPPRRLLKGLEGLKGPAARRLARNFAVVVRKR